MSEFKPGGWPGKVVTEVSPVGPFWEAEPEHQDYLERFSAWLHLSFHSAGLAAPGARTRASGAVMSLARDALLVPDDPPLL